MVRLTKYRRGRYRQPIEAERERKVQRAVAKEMSRAAEVKQALRERLDPVGRRLAVNEHGQPL